jgi:hypothetical protein
MVDIFGDRFQLGVRSEQVDGITEQSAMNATGAMVIEVLLTVAVLTVGAIVTWAVIAIERRLFG